MKISTRGRYALRFLLDLAQQPQDKYIALKDIAERQHVSKKYLEQIVPLLTKNGMLRGNRGQQGGYQLTRPLNAYSVGEILRVTEGSISPVACLDEENVRCENRGSCLTIGIWRGLQRVINEYLDSITLQDILDEQKQDGQSEDAQTG